MSRKHQKCVKVPAARLVWSLRGCEQPGGAIGPGHVMEARHGAMLVVKPSPKLAANTETATIVWNELDELNECFGCFFQLPSQISSGVA